MLLAVGEELREQERLLAYELVRFYRTLRQEGHLTDKQLSRLEEDVFRPGTPPDEMTIWVDLPEIHLTDTPTDQHLTLQVISFFPRPVPLPWERDPDFFEKRPKYKAVLYDISNREDRIDWYRQLWLAVVEKFPW